MTKKAPSQADSPERILVTIGDEEGTSVLAEMSEDSFVRLVRSLCDCGGPTPRPLLPAPPPPEPPAAPSE